jgi:Transposase
MVDVCEEAAELVARMAVLDVGKKGRACGCRARTSRGGAGRRSVRSRRLPGRCWSCGTGRCGEQVSLCVRRPRRCTGSRRITCSKTRSSAGWSTPATPKSVPGRSRTDRLDAVWLCKLAERGMLRPSFVPPPWQRELRDLCRYQRTLIQEHSREKQPRPRLARPPRPAAPQAPAHRRTRTPIRQEGPAPRIGLTNPPTEPSCCAPPGAAARPAEHRFSIQCTHCSTDLRRPAHLTVPLGLAPAQSLTTWLHGGFY